MATTTNYSWSTPDDTALVKDGAAAIRSLGTAIDTTVFNNASAAIAKTIVDAKGDIIAATAADTVSRLAVGADNSVLTADSTTATGLKWANSASGGLTLISETVASGLSSLSFTSLGNYKQLLLMWAGVRHSGTGSAFTLRFNNNSTAATYVTSGCAFQDGNQNTSMGAESSLIKTAPVSIYAFGESASLGSDAHNAGGSVLIDNYTSSTKSKTYTAMFGYYDASGDRHVSLNLSGYFGSQTAITSIDIVRLTGSATFSNINNTTIRLYGVA